MPVHPHSARSRSLCSECFPTCCSCKCGPSHNDAAHGKTPFSCGLRQPLELIPGKLSLAFLRYAFLRTYGQSADWRGEEWSHNWEQWLNDRAVTWNIGKLSVTCFSCVLWCCLHCSSLCRVDISVSLLLPFPTAKQLQCCALLLAFTSFRAIEYGCNGGVSARGRCIAFSSN